MFAGVADRYDRANRILSMGVDVRWRKAAVAFAGVGAGEEALDVCAGTGDLTCALRDAGARVVGSDFCPEMLAHAVDKWPHAERPRYVAGDTLKLPFRDDSFDLATVAFGIRNVEDPTAGIRELARVVRPGGRVVVLEFCRPRVPLFRSAYMLYFRRILPRLGSWITGDRAGAYEYLPDSVMAFPEREQFLELMRDAGLVAPKMKVLTGGIAALYRGEVEERTN
ncbi:MAG: ubiquinone/menaquinone biosynthesis methyltransferase [Planctomycetes bacterium]|nr:ubiquinone/menaquinone biosynthesis methyltransferase [Planctomycetota bacterium]